MKALRLALNICAGLCVLAGCAGSQTAATMPKEANPTVFSGDASGQRLFVTDYTGNAVLVYNPAKQNPKPERRITIGLNEPSGDCIDAKGTLYVINSSGWISVYPAGRNRPTKIIKRGMGEGTFCAIDSSGNLWVTSLYVSRLKRRSGASLIEYARGSKTPTTIIMKGVSYPLGVAIDQSGNMYVANRFGSSSGNIVVYAPGKKTPFRTITAGITSPIGIAIDANGILYVANIFQNTVAEYEPGASEPFQTITQGLSDPAGVTVSQQGWLYVANFGNNSISEYAPGSLEPSTQQISKGLYAPQGVAYSPPVLP